MKYMAIIFYLQGRHKNHLLYFLWGKVALGAKENFNDVMILEI